MTINLFGALNSLNSVRLCGATLVAGLILPAAVSAGEYITANAPITYKMSDPGRYLGSSALSGQSMNVDQLLLDGYSKQGSPSLPQMPTAKLPAPRIADLAVPQPSAPQVKAPQIKAPDVSPKLDMPKLPVTPKSMDLSTIDRQLYKHMKVGRPYTVAGKTYTPTHNPDYDEVGTASWYGDKFHGKLTANGERYDKMAMTAAHKTLPLNSYVIVTNIETGKSLKLRLNDRGPFIGGRIIDLSEAAARELGYIGKGLGKVRVQYAGPAEPKGQKDAYKPLRQTDTPKGQSNSKSAQAPSQLSEDEYKPLRQLAEQNLIKPMGGQPKQPLLDIPSILDTVPTPKAPVRQPQQNVELPKLAPIPKASAPRPAEDGVVTLTIKGPIHMAKHSNNDNVGKPRVIPAVYRRVVTD